MYIEKETKKFDQIFNKQSKIELSIYSELECGIRLKKL